MQPFKNKHKTTRASISKLINIVLDSRRYKGIYVISHCYVDKSRHGHRSCGVTDLDLYQILEINLLLPQYIYFLLALHLKPSYFIFKTTQIIKILNCSSILFIFLKT